MPCGPALHFLANKTEEVAVGRTSVITLRNATWSATLMKVQKQEKLLRASLRLNGSIQLILFTVYPAYRQSYKKQTFIFSCRLERDCVNLLRDRLE
ncbi:hypothetical protein J6590_056220 [Homalodisca vitripennis]|nr:hypothetical protein J6590_056220 [Homalodisca vitripennis]